MCVPDTISPPLPSSHHDLFPLKWRLRTILSSPELDIVMHLFMMMRKVANTVSDIHSQKCSHSASYLHL